MADSVQLITEMVAYLDTLPKTPNGDVKVEDPTALAVAFVGIVAPVYGAELDELLMRADGAEALAASRQNELIGLRGDVDSLRAAVAQAVGALASGNVAAAQSALATVG
jgi:hypothetical protein